MPREAILAWSGQMVAADWSQRAEVEADVGTAGTLHEMFGMPAESLMRLESRLHAA